MARGKEKSRAIYKTFGPIGFTNTCKWPFNKLMPVFLCVCPVIDDEIRHNIAKVAVDSRGDSQVDPQTPQTML